MALYWFISGCFSGISVYSVVSALHYFRNRENRFLSNLSVKNSMPIFSNLYELLGFDFKVNKYKIQEAYDAKRKAARKALIHDKTGEF